MTLDPTSSKATHSRVNVGQIVGAAFSRCDCKVRINTEFSLCPFLFSTVQQTLLRADEAYCAELTYSYCDFSAVVDSLAKRIELRGAKEKS